MIFVDSDTYDEVFICFSALEHYHYLVITATLTTAEPVYKYAQVI
jgi:hypothetical protein